MIENDARLFDRLRDLQGTLGEDLDWLAPHPPGRPPRADGLRDLGERLADLGTALIQRADELNASVLAKLPKELWIPEAATAPGRVRKAHYAGQRPIRCGLVYLAMCGAACYPYYGRDSAGKIARHPPCAACQRWAN